MNERLQNTRYAPAHIGGVWREAKHHLWRMQLGVRNSQLEIKRIEILRLLSVGYADKSRKSETLLNKNQ